MITTLIATIALAQQQDTTRTAQIQPTYQGNLVLMVGEKQTNLGFKANRSMSKTAGTYTWTEPTLTVDGTAQAAPAIRSFTYSIDPDGMVSNFAGGYSNLFAPTGVLLLHLFQPRTPLSVGSSSDFQVPKGSGYGAYKITVKRNEDEDMNGQMVQVYQQTEKSVDDDSLDANGMFWLLSDGTLVKMNQSISKIKLASGETASGTLTLTKVGS